MKQGSPLNMGRHYHIRFTVTDHDKTTARRDTANNDLPDQFSFGFLYSLLTVLRTMLVYCEEEEEERESNKQVGRYLVVCLFCLVVLPRCG